jgi:cobyrinic acid a,c-diamide synthase
VGPDFIDPGYHTLAAGRSCRNLDTWICGNQAVRQLFRKGMQGADIAVVEGVMGLFDGASGSDERASTAEVAKLIGAPVLLVIDGSAIGRSVAALVHGFTTFDPDLRVAGIVWNRVGSPGHRTMLDDAVAGSGVPVLGALESDDRLAWRDRHLGLVPVAERPAEIARTVELLGSLIASSVDLKKVEELAATAATPTASEWQAPPGSARARIALASGRAFTFAYPETVEALSAAGSEVVTFDPLAEEALPSGVGGLFVGGGFPELYGAELSANDRLRADVARRIGEGLAVWGECAGLMWLARSLDRRPMVGAVPVDVSMTDRLTLGYRSGTSASASPLGPAGIEVRGHEFHYSALAERSPSPAWILRGRGGEGHDGYATARILASYLHLHPAGNPSPYLTFAANAAKR